MPTALTVTFRDYGGGTVKATVAGTGGAAVVVPTARVTGDTWPPPAWSDPPPGRVGDGDVPLFLAPGFYFGYAKGPDVTPPVWFGVAGDPAAVATRCRDAVAARLALLPLASVARIHDETWLESANKDWPCVVLSLEGLQEREEAGLDGLDLIGHPVRVSVCDNLELRDRRKLRERYEPWRQQISDAFRWQKIPGVSDRFNHCVVETLDIADPRNPNYQRFVSAQIVWCWVYRTRGV